jgi:hypothetical protein
MATTTIKFNESIKNKLDYFLATKKIPNIIFHGSCGSGKRTIVNNFVYDIYEQNKNLIQTYVMNVNCAHGKGIKFVREELKFFAKTHINNIGTSCFFKTIILSNADKLTIDAQSALRRCIELFSHNTRFFIIVEDKYKLLKPIISRFCEIFITEPTVGASSKRINLHKYNIQQSFKQLVNNLHDKNREIWLHKKIQSFMEEPTNPVEATTNPMEATTNPMEATTNPMEEQTKQYDDIKKKPNLFLFDLSIQLYEKGYCGIDLMNYIEKDTTTIDAERKYHLLLFLQKIKKDIRNEKMFLLIILQFLLFRSKKDLENISFM